MKYFRSVLMVFVVVACFCLAGFKKQTHNHEPSTKTQHSEDQAKPQKSLDLTVPSRNVSFEESPEILAIGQSVPPNALSVVNQGKPRVIDLNGHFIMSQEPEAEKMKSTDGAGVVINLHH
jgi:hypothetical protein